MIVVASLGTWPETYDRAADPGDTGVGYEYGGGTDDLADGDGPERASGPEG